MIPPEDMQPGESYAWTYKNFEGKDVRSQGKFLYHGIALGIYWFMFELKDGEGNSHKCPWEYSCFVNIEKLPNYETPPS